MEGFYYDAEIEHIAEIIKNNLYFAVLEKENTKVLKSTHDTCYFCVDDELVYTNYYFDFGPLNISCVYKYCCNLNNYLKYSHGYKRIVHYTSSNPTKRVNAAFLMGSYSVIYLQMEPRDIYRILFNTGGPFKGFVDASQGISQYTIPLLDCLLAVKKALTFNFFNFNDFNMEEYDLYDKLQNGDMNWLLPRKFLAFIGPTDNALLSGHPPDFYIKYFLENDIKTVIRLNNKVYDASAFTHVGIDHHELFFPDGTVPSKQILLKFLEVSENARAAVAVHCKAGLGRTGSLIGAYIVKHYHFTAREAIAWMRICRPGSVIGQQQGWLEKIEGWLWKQGHLYRLQHFGEGDKIPHHKYGIYSREWPKEREKLIRHVQRKRLEVQGNYGWQTKLESEPLANIYNSMLPYEYPIHNRIKTKTAVAKSHFTGQKLPAASTKDERCKKVSKTLNKMQKNLQSGNRPSKITKNKELYRIQDISTSNTQRCEESETKSKSQYTESTKRKERTDTETNRINKSNETRLKKYANTYYAPNNRVDTVNSLNESRLIRSNFKKFTHNEEKDCLTEGRLRKYFVGDLEQTQGDKLNEIKAKRLANSIDDRTENKLKQNKPRRRCITSATMDIFNKIEARSKNQQLELQHPLLKKSYLEHSSKN